MFAQRARKDVENSRLMLDAKKAKQSDKAHPGDGTMDEEVRAEIEQAEDEFVNQTEEAAGVMKNVSDVQWVS